MQRAIHIVNSFLFLTYVMSWQGLREAFVVWPGIAKHKKNLTGV